VLTGWGSGRCGQVMTATVNVNHEDGHRRPGLQAQAWSKARRASAAVTRVDVVLADGKPRMVNPACFCCVAQGCGDRRELEMATLD
jgi:hypothetical protein